MTPALSSLAGIPGPVDSKCGQLFLIQALKALDSDCKTAEKIFYVGQEFVGWILPLSVELVRW